MKAFFSLVVKSFNLIGYTYKFKFIQSLDRRLFLNDLPLFLMTQVIVFKMFMLDYTPFVLQNSQNTVHLATNERSS